MAALTATQRRLQEDACEVLGVDRRGGKLLWRDHNTMLVSGCEQVGQEQLALLKTLHKNVHLMICSSTEKSALGVAGFVVVATLLPKRSLWFSGEGVQFVIALSVYITSLLCFWPGA